MREKLIRKREKKGLTVEEMAKRCHCSPRLIRGIEEEDWITHPKIAAWIAKEYGLGIRAYNELVHESRRAEKLPEPELPVKADEWSDCFKILKFI